MFAFLALLTATAPAAGHPPPEQAAVRLSPVQLFEFAERLRSGGRVEDAERAYRALATNPDKDIRSEARFRLARMLAAHDRSSEAAILLRQVLDERPGAQRVRIELATLLARMGQVAAAQKELRAAQAGSLPSDVARLVDRFSGALRARSPHGVSVTFAVAPDTNINRGTQLDRLGTVLGDFIIDREAKRRSGVGFQIDAEAFVRRRVNDHLNFLVKGVAAARLYARPGFNDISIAPSIGPEIALGSDRLNVAAAASRRWFGGHPYADAVGLEATYEHPLAGTAVLRAAGAAYRVDNRVNNLEDGTQLSLSGGGEFAISPRAGIGANTTIIRRALRDAGYSNRSVYPTLYGWREVGRATLSSSVTIGWLGADDRLLIYPTKRRDHYVRIALGGVWRHLMIGGFAPSFQFIVEHNRSTVAIYDYRRRAAEFGLSHVF